MGIGFLLRISEMPNPKAPSLVVLSNEKTRIGRKSEVQMDTMQGKEVSKHHSTIYRRTHGDREVWIIEDKKSLNGTFLNGQKIHRVLMNHGDIVVFGGGPKFIVGDEIASTELSECRYVFYIAPSPVRFCDNVDLNASLTRSSLLDICPICYESIVATETLPCGHCFCLCCIHKWSNVCQEKNKPCICPLCRSVFKPSDLSPKEGVMTNKELKVYSLEPMMRDLGVRNCKQFKRVSIFKKWNQKHKRYFNSIFEKIKGNELRVHIFLYLTKATPLHAFTEHTESLKNAITNFGEVPLECQRNELISQYLQLLFKKLIPKPNVSTIILLERNKSSRGKRY